MRKLKLSFNVLVLALFFAAMKMGVDAQNYFMVGAVAAFLAIHIGSWWADMRREREEKQARLKDNRPWTKGTDF